MTPEELFEAKKRLVFSAIEQQFGSYQNAKQIAENNNMEIDDLIQVGQMQLWELCLRYDPKKEKSFNGYAMKHMKWRMSDEIHNKGTIFILNSRTSIEERNQISIQSIDLHQEGEVVNEFFAVSPINVAEEVISSIEFEEITSVLDEEEKILILHISEGYTAEEIALKFGIGRSTVHYKKNKAFLKINPNYSPTKKKSYFLGARSLKENHLLQQVI
ncbi:sigma-70 family RNA polymerase sigma factor [Bacillus thuringiensis]|uniref:sigma-70 family RNA polymerase sigma factor n=1 Tax=Bacillus thuringiensis TaxID=1428 RepID=UPI00366B2749